MAFISVRKYIECEIIDFDLFIRFLYQDAEGNSDFDIDLLDVLTLYSRNPAGRELAWYYYRENWAQLQSEYVFQFFSSLQLCCLFFLKIIVMKVQIND